MRVAPPPAKKPYVWSEYPAIMYPGTPLQAQGLIRTQIAVSKESEAAWIKQGYQRTQADPPKIPVTATKEEALAEIRHQFDCAWRVKMSEVATLQTKFDALTAEHRDLKREHGDLKAQYEAASRRLADLTRKKEPVVKVAGAEE